MPLTPDDLGSEFGTEVQELVDKISKAKRAVKDIKEAYGLDEAENRLKELLSKIPTDDKGHHSVVVNGVKAKVFFRSGRYKADIEVARKLLHSNTFNAIFTFGEPSKVLEVDPARVPPMLDEIFAVKIERPKTMRVRQPKTPNTKKPNDDVDDYYK